MQRILTVDDNPLDNMINEMMLRRNLPGYEIITFSDPTEASHFVKQNKADLPGSIILDINMPLISGWDLAEELLKMDYRGNVFMLTSSVFHGDEARAKQFPFVREYFIKPLTADMAKRIKVFSTSGSKI